MSTKEILLEQLKACHNQTGWFVTINTAVEGLTAEQAVWSGENPNNSIRQIVNHLIFWNSRYLNRFKGIPNPEFKGDNDDTFETGNKSEADWKKTVEEMDDLMTEWEAALNEADEAKLETPLNKNEPEGTLAAFIAHLNIHSAYHIGQIVTLRKQQGSWDKSKGVN